MVLFDKLLPEFFIKSTVCCNYSEILAEKKEINTKHMNYIVSIHR